MTDETETPLAVANWSMQLPQWVRRLFPKDFGWVGVIYMVAATFIMMSVLTNLVMRGYLSADNFLFHWIESVWIQHQWHWIVAIASVPALVPALLSLPFGKRKFFRGVLLTLEVIWGIALVLLGLYWLSFLGAFLWEGWATLFG